ncbi:MAG: 4Fe-4S binding protein [Acidilobaceae archaeon]
MRRGPFALLALLDKPVVDKWFCSSLRRCDSCIKTCPVRALSGRPPEVSYEVCISCGACYSVCPVEAISSPFLTWRSLKEYCKVLRRRSEEPAHVVVAKPTEFKDLEKLEVEYPTVLLPLESSRNLTPLHALLLASYGFTLHIISRTPPSWLSELSAVGLVHHSKSVDELAETLSRRPLFKPFHVDVNLTKSRSFVRLVLKLLDKELKFNYPLTGEVYIHEDLCVLCGACVEACPTKTLKLGETEDRFELSFDPNLCVVCKECEKVCPEGAVRIENVYKPDSSWRVEVSGAVVRCSKCGAIVSSEKQIRKIESKLRSIGTKDTSYLRLCIDCRQKSLLGE